MPSSALPLRRRLGTAAPVFLNVYDVTAANGYARWFGLGAYHSGVQVHGVEYSYGAHDGETSGIFEVAPRRCPGYAFREVVVVGTTELSRREVRRLMAELAADFPGDAYNVVSWNCNHFCDAACRRLAAAPIPKWVNRLSKIGGALTCGIPEKGKPKPSTSEDVRRKPNSFRTLSLGCKNMTQRRTLSSLFEKPPSTSLSSFSSSTSLLLQPAADSSCRR